MNVGPAHMAAMRAIKKALDPDLGQSNLEDLLSVSRGANGGAGTHGPPPGLRGGTSRHSVYGHEVSSRQSTPSTEAGLAVHGTCRDPPGGNLGPVYARFALRLQSLSFVGGERFIEAVREFYDGKSRLIIAFRHPYGDEPQVLTYAMHHGVPREAKRLGTPLSCRPHCSFLHGYEVPLGRVPWSDGSCRARGPCLSTTSAPTGPGSGEYEMLSATASIRSHSRPRARSRTAAKLSRGSSGVPSSSVFRGAEELEKARRSERVLILPVSMHALCTESDLGSWKGSRVIWNPGPPCRVTAGLRRPTFPLPRARAQAQEDRSRVAGPG